MIDPATMPDGLTIDLDAGDTLAGRYCSGNRVLHPAKHSNDTYLTLSPTIDFQYLSSHNHVTSSSNAYNRNSNIKYNISLPLCPNTDSNNKLVFTRNSYKDIRVNFLKGYKANYHYNCNIKLLYNMTN